MNTTCTRILTALATTVAAGLVGLAAGQAEAAEILRPMYINPSSDYAAWEAVADACAGGTPITVVVNAHNGPGFAGDNMPDAAYENAIRLLDDAGCSLLGYVATGGTSPVARVNPEGQQSYEQDCNDDNECLNHIYGEMMRWANDWAVDGEPRLDGFFFDEVHPSPQNQQFYELLALLTRHYTNGPAMSDHKVFFNAGGPATWFGGDNQSFVDIADVYVVLENTGAEVQGFDIPADLESYAPEKLAVLAHSADAALMSELVAKAEAEELGYLMVTSDAWHETDTHWGEFTAAMTPAVSCDELLMASCYNPDGPTSYPGQCLGQNVLIYGYCVIVEGSCYGSYVPCDGY